MFNCVKKKLICPKDHPFHIITPKCPTCLSQDYPLPTNLPNELPYKTHSPACLMRSQEYSSNHHDQYFIIQYYVQIVFHFQYGITLTSGTILFHGASLKH